MDGSLFERLRPVERAGHEVSLLESGREYFPALIEAIAAARAEIFFETYIFADDVAGRAVAHALAAAAARGVTVRLVVDGYGTPKLVGVSGHVLRESRVEVRVFRPKGRGFALSRDRLRRLHRKMVVVDRRLAFVGGLNVLDDLWDPNHGRLDEPRLDFAVRVRGPLVASAHLAVHRLWWQLALIGRGRRGRAAAAREALEDVRDAAVEALEDVPEAAGEPRREGSADAPLTAGVRAMLVLRDNLRFRRTIEREYLRAIQRARSEILIANAYFFPGARFRRALLQAARRGVRVRLLLQGRVEYAVQHYGSRALYDELLNGGIEIVEYRPSFMHAKVAVIDDWATVGSSNIDPFSLLLAREANVVVRDAAFAASLRARLLRAMEHGGVTVVPQHHARRAWPVRLLYAIGWLILRLGVAISGYKGRY